MVVRAPRRSELPALQAVERAAGAAFADVGLPEIAADDPPTVATLERFRAAGRALVAERDGALAAYLLWLPLDDAAHVEQVTVDPGHAGHRLGAALIDHVGRTAGRPALTLTAFAAVAWNAPYYARLGFAVLDPADQGPQLRAHVAAEREQISGDAPRVAMRRRVR